MAAAYAETRNFPKAIVWEKKALSFPEFARSNEPALQRLQLYELRRPYRNKQHPKSSFGVVF